MKYITLVKYDFKNILRDKMLLALLIYPFLMGFMFGYLIPLLLEVTTSDLGDIESEAIKTSMITLVLLVSSLGSIIGGSLLGMMILDSKDDSSISSIAVSPIGLKGFLIYRCIISYLLATLGTFTIIFIIDASGNYELGSLNLIDYLLISLVMGFTAPFIGLIMSTFAKNKVQGFAAIKLSGLIAAIPLIIMIESFRDWKQFIFGIFPNFWAVLAFNKKLEYFPENSYTLNFYLYLIIGLLISLIAIIISLKIFIRRFK